jgi:hypothetical protein
MRHLQVIALLGLFTATTTGCNDTPSARAAERTSALPSSRVEQPLASKSEAQPAPKPELVATAEARVLPSDAALTPKPIAADMPTPILPGVSLVRFELAEGVQAREPVRPSAAFAAGSTVYAFLELANKEGAATALWVKFERDGAKPSKALRLEVPKMERYRTHAFTGNTSKPGTYRCTVSTENGQVVASKAFAIQPTDL